MSTVEKIYTVTSEVSSCMEAYVLKAKNIDDALNIFATFDTQFPLKIQSVLTKKEKKIVAIDNQGYTITIQEADFDKVKVFFIGSHEG
jgi:hypothetical protein